MSDRPGVYQECDQLRAQLHREVDTVAALSTENAQLRAHLAQYTAVYARLKALTDRCIVTSHDSVPIATLRRILADLDAKEGKP